MTLKQSIRDFIFSTNMTDLSRSRLMPVFSTCSDRFPDEALSKGVDLVEWIKRCSRSQVDKYENT